MRYVLCPGAAASLPCGAPLGKRHVVQRPATCCGEQQQLYRAQRHPLPAPWLGLQHAGCARGQGGSSARARCQTQRFFSAALLCQRPGRSTRACTQPASAEAALRETPPRGKRRGYNARNKFRCACASPRPRTLPFTKCVGGGVPPPLCGTFCARRSCVAAVWRVSRKRNVVLAGRDVCGRTLPRSGG
jgi:hypothetical protein